MFRKKIDTPSLSKFTHRKNFSEVSHFRTIKPRVSIVKLVFISIFLLVTCGLFILFFTGGNSYLQIIVGYSMTGFFTFFMGYLGWILARIAITSFSDRDKKVENGVIYYFKRFRKNKE